MPCNDITETISIKLDENDRLIRYSFIKRACGGNIGRQSLILDLLEGRSIEEILQIGQADLLAAANPSNPEERFLVLKHLIVIQSCLEIMQGLRNIDPRDRIKLYSVNYGPEGIELEADIKLNFKVEEINPCSDCGCRLN
jgi:NifU-like protein involved in Fe-S cluster formation